MRSKQGQGHTAGPQDGGAHLSRNTRDLLRCEIDQCL